MGVFGGDNVVGEDLPAMEIRTHAVYNLTENVPIPPC